MKRKLSMILILSMILLLVGSQGAFAATNTVTDQNILVYNEYQTLKQLSQKSPSELKNLGFSDEVVNNPANIIPQYIEKLTERSKLSTEELKTLGYTDAQIAIFKNFKGTAGQIEALSSNLTIKPGTGKKESKIQSSSVFRTQATVNIGEWISSYYYDSTNKRTYADIALNWAWDSCPTTEFWDAVAFAWSGSFIQTASNDVNNYAGVTYRISSNTTETRTKGWACAPGQGCDIVFEMALDGLGLQWAQSGYAKARIYTDSYTPSFGLTAAYGHQTIMMSPSVNFGGGGSIGFSTGVVKTSTYHVYNL